MATKPKRRIRVPPHASLFSALGLALLFGVLAFASPPGDSDSDTSTALAGGKQSKDELSGKATNYVLDVTDAGRPLIRPDDGGAIPIIKNSRRGFVQAYRFNGKRLTVTGWAADPQEGRVARELLLFSNGKFVSDSPKRLTTPDVAKEFGKPSLSKAGFEFDLPAKGHSRQDVEESLRIYAVIGFTAGQLLTPTSNKQS